MSTIRVRGEREIQASVGEQPKALIICWIGKEKRKKWKSTSGVKRSPFLVSNDKLLFLWLANIHIHHLNLKSAIYSSGDKCFFRVELEIESFFFPFQQQIG